MKTLERFWHWVDNETPLAKHALAKSKSQLSATASYALELAATIIDCHRDPSQSLGCRMGAALDMLEAWPLALRDLSLSLCRALEALEAQVPRGQTCDYVTLATPPENAGLIDWRRIYEEMGAKMPDLFIAEADAAARDATSWHDLRRAFTARPVLRIVRDDRSDTLHVHPSVDRRDADGLRGRSGVVVKLTGEADDYDQDVLGYLFTVLDAGKIMTCYECPEIGRRWDAWRKKKGFLSVEVAASHPDASPSGSAPAGDERS